MMSLPTYEEAVQSPNIISLLVDFLDVPTLRTVSCVNAEWHESASDRLWEDPVRTIIRSGGSVNLRVHNFVNKAERYTEKCRLRVLMLNFDPLTARYHKRQGDWVLYEDLFSCRWVLSKLKHFQNLNSVITDGLPYFPAGGSLSVDLGSSMDCDTKLKMLSCIGTRQFLMETWFNSDLMKSVIYLDISYTLQSSFSSWRSAFCATVLQGRGNQLANLRVLKLRGMRLGELPGLPSHHTGNKLIWSLDVRDNLLTDSDIGSIYGLFLRNYQEPEIPSTNVQLADVPLYEAAPDYKLHSDHSPIWPRVSWRSDTKADCLSYLESQGRRQPNNSLSIDSYLSDTGITHLHLSGNNFTFKGISLLLSLTNRLQVLSLGSVLSGQNDIPHTKSYHIPSFRLYPGTKLSSLEVHHSVITGVPTYVRSSLSDGFLVTLLPHAESFPSVKFDIADHPTLTSLALTSIPSLSTGPTIERLCAFLRQCAAQELCIAAASTTFAQRHRRAPPLLSGLRALKLEILGPSVEGTDCTLGSVSGHEDADRFQKEMEGDFSFFDEGGQQRSVARESGANRVKENNEERVRITESATKSVMEKDLLIVVDELKKWRASEVPRWGGKLEVMLVSGTRSRSSARG